MDTARRLGRTDVLEGAKFDSRLNTSRRQSGLRFILRLLCMPDVAIMRRPELSRSCDDENQRKVNTATAIAPAKNRLNSFGLTGTPRVSVTGRSTTPRQLE